MYFLSALTFGTKEKPKKFVDNSISQPASTSHRPTFPEETVTFISEIPLWKQSKCQKLSKVVTVDNKRLDQAAGQLKMSF